MRRFHSASTLAGTRSFTGIFARSLAPRASGRFGVEWMADNEKCPRAAATAGGVAQEVLAP